MLLALGRDVAERGVASRGVVEKVVTGPAAEIDLAVEPVVRVGDVRPCAAVDTLEDLERRGHDLVVVRLRVAGAVLEGVAPAFVHDHQPVDRDDVGHRPVALEDWLRATVGALLAAEHVVEHQLYVGRGGGFGDRRDGQEKGQDHR